MWPSWYHSPFPTFHTLIWIKFLQVDMIDYSKAPHDLFLRHILWFSNQVRRSSYGFDQQLPLKKGIQFGMPCIVICLLYGCSLALTPKPKITSAKRTSTPCSRTSHGFSNVLPQLKHIVGIPTFFEATFSPQFFALGNTLFGKKILIFNVIWFLACQVRVSVDLARSIQHCELAILCQAKHRHQIKYHMTC